MPDDEPTTWTSPLATRPKKAIDEIRICVDMRKANKAMLGEKTEFPTVEDAYSSRVKWCSEVLQT